jgi:hypothetical protein
VDVTPTDNARIRVLLSARHSRHRVRSGLGETGPMINDQYKEIRGIPHPLTSREKM